MADFQTALTALRAGDRAKRAAWQAGELSIFTAATNGTVVEAFLIVDTPGTTRPWIITAPDLLADDWSVVAT